MIDITEKQKNDLMQTALAIAVVLLVVFIAAPQYLPRCIWKQRQVRKASRCCTKAVESFVGDSNVVAGPITSYYRTLTKKDFGENHTVVGLHYADWCGYCKLMKPIWHNLKEELMTNPDYSALVMIENDEDANPTPGISGYPTIIKYVGGKARRYHGRADKQQLREFILGTEIVDTSGAAF